MTAELKRCAKCGADKPLNQFDPSRLRPGRIKTVCRPCCRDISKEAAAAKRRERKLNAKGNTYASRNGNLRRLGFATYRDYLASDLWRAVRKQVYAAKGSACYLCGNPATELHHNRYHKNDLVGKRLKYINPICRSCHEGIEFSDGEKATLRQAAKAFRKGRKAKNREKPT